MNRLCSILLPALLAGLFLSACSRKEIPAPKPAPTAPANSKVLNIADATVTAGLVYIKSTGEQFTGTLHESWPGGKLRRETGMKSGLRHGSFKEWLENGWLDSTGQFVAGKLDGVHVKFTEDGLQRIETTFEHGRKVSQEVKQTAKMKAEWAAKEAANLKLNETVWKPEEESQTREQTFVKLWDDLRAMKHEWNPLEQFDFKSLRIGELGAAHQHDWGIERREMGGAKTKLDPAGWRAMIKKWRAASIRIIETEWHQASFEPAKEGQPARSLFKVVAHVVDEALQTRHILRGDLRVQWSPKRGVDGLFGVEHMTLEELTLLSRKGPAPFVTKHVIDVLKDNPGVTPPKSNDINLWGRVYPPSLVLQDLNGDHLPELITGGGNLVYWNRGGFKLEPKVLLEGNNGFNHAIVFADFTGDGHLDLFTLNPRKNLEVIPGDGKGKFTPSALESTLPGGAHMENISCHAVGDIDGDGDLDVYATQYKSAFKNGVTPKPYYDAMDGHPAYLLLNDGTGRFTDATAQARLLPKRHRRTYSASLVDLDNDHDLDLLVVSDFAGMDLYLNDGKGKFTDVTERLGEHRFSFGMSHSLADFDGDGNLDIYMVGMGSTTARRLDGMKLRRQGFKTVQDARAAMGYGNRLFLGDGRGGYRQAPYNKNVARSGWSWGSTPWDFDNDGDRDLFVANGHLSGKSCEDYCSKYWRRWTFPDEAQERPLMDLLIQTDMKDLTNGEISWNGFEHNVLFMNEGGGKYTNIAFLMGVSHESDCRSVVSGDLDHDGRPDLLVVEGVRRGTDQQREGYIQVIQNLLTTGNHWIGTHLKGQPIGAVVSVVNDGKRQILPIVTGDSFDSQHATSAHFGLGKSKSVEALEVRWPNGKVTRVKNPAIDKYHIIRP